MTATTTTIITEPSTSCRTGSTTTRAILKLKRGRREMTGSALPAPVVTSGILKKEVRFCESSSSEEMEPCRHHYQQQQQREEDEPLQALWYTRQEQYQQLANAQRAIPAWRGRSPTANKDIHWSYDYGILLEDSYENPHSKVQEYLQAFCAQDYVCPDDDSSTSTSSATTTMRGLELLVGTAHALERQAAKRKHRAAVLDCFAASHSTETTKSDNADSWEEALAQLSRTYSACSKVFAMRLGRADARAAAHDCNISSTPTTNTTTTIVLNQLADTICQEHRRRQQWKEHQEQVKREKEQQRQLISAAVGNIEELSTDKGKTCVALSCRYPNEYITAILLRNLLQQIISCNTGNNTGNNNHPKATLSSLICLQAATANHSRAYYWSPKYNTYVTVSLPIHHVVYGRYPLSPPVMAGTMKV